MKPAPVFSTSHNSKPSKKKQFIMKRVDRCPIRFPFSSVLSNELIPQPHPTLSPITCHSAPIQNPSSISTDIIDFTMQANTPSKSTSTSPDTSDFSDSQISSLQNFHLLSHRIRQLGKTDRLLSRLLSCQSPLTEDFLLNKHITPKMRTKVVKWLKVLCQQLELSDLTQFTAVNTLDRYLASTNEQVKYLQLAAATCVYMSSKIHETRLLNTSVFVYSCSNLFTSEQILQKEKEILERVNFRVDCCNTYRLLKEIRKAMGVDKNQFKEEVRLLKVAQQNGAFYKYPDVMVVKAAILLAEDEPKPSAQDLELQRSTSSIDMSRLQEQLKELSQLDHA